MNKIDFITGGKAGMKTDRKRKRPYATVEIRYYPKVEPSGITEWSMFIEDCVQQSLTDCSAIFDKQKNEKTDQIKKV